jgi:hypothetical protein
MGKGKSTGNTLESAPQLLLLGGNSINIICIIKWGKVPVPTTLELAPYLMFFAGNSSHPCQMRLLGIPVLVF